MLPKITRMLVNYMNGRLSKVVLGAISLGTIATLGFNMFRPMPQLFDPQKLELISASEILVPISTILPIGVAKVCVLGPYSNVKFQLATADPKLLQQMDQSSVDEGSVRIAMFDNQSKILGEYDLPRGHSQIRIALDNIVSAFCRDTEIVLVKVVSQKDFITIQFAK